ncbi:MAG: prepilin-type N-terminal cleavage/methylation domain-containing protein [Akkermansiaceae bacterium]|jgi:prepilin-type N-terminal cleavage/methylation domain-containing protein|tara:strand:- start:20880 stop:21719 length:840 start_codon:yes stop_codon:yes gene_type:complete
MRTKPNQKSKLRSRGFTLLEVVVALGMMAMLIGGIFQVARTSLQLSQIVVEEQNSTMERNAFFNLLKNHFEQMPGNAVVRLESYDSSNGGVSRTLFNLTFQNVPMSFNWGDVPMTAEAIELATVEQRDGFVDVVLRFYDVEILEDSDSTGDLEAEPIAEITLIENLWMCDCEVVDGRTLEHVTEWDNNGQLPLQVKFYCRFEPTADIMQQTFWVVPKQNPEVIFRQIMQQNPAGPQGTTGAGGNVPPITINPGQPIPGSGGGRPGGGSTPPGGIPSGGR